MSWNLWIIQSDFIQPLSDDLRPGSEVPPRRFFLFMKKIIADFPLRSFCMIAAETQSKHKRLVVASRVVFIYKVCQ
ncbi:MAG: hypothetical protein JWO95_2832 [Verrucomicrobiales bacterium]|nr:hypothetical protein [Verrucomicrobiales bacterium]